MNRSVYGVLLVGAALSLAGPAFAQTASPHWTGFYVGAGAQYGSGHSGMRGQEPSHGLHGVRGALATGYMWETPSRITLGLEAEVSGGDVSGRARVNLLPTYDFRYRDKVDFAGDARVRLGYDLGMVMPYATVGTGYGHLKTSLSTYVGGGGYQGNDYYTNLFGATAGVGLEYAASRHVSIDVEYRHTQFLNATMSGYGDIKLRTDHVGARLAWHP